MLEAMLCARSAGCSSKETPLIGYNYSDNRSTGTSPIVSAHDVNQLVAPPIAIAGYSKVLAGSGRSNTFTPVTPLNVGTGDFTLELRTLLKSTSGYVHLFWTNSAPSTGLRVEDWGYGDRVVCFVNANTHVFNTAMVRSDLENVWRHLVLQRRAGAISVYLDGNKIGLAPDRGSTYSLVDQTASDSLVGTSNAGVGYSGYGTGYYAAEFAFYDKARYTKNFIPPVGPIAP